VRFRHWPEPQSAQREVGTISPVDAGFQRNARFVDHAVQITQFTQGEVDGAADASRVAVAVSTPDPKLTTPGEMIVLSVGKALWMQMSGWKAPNRGKWLDLAAQGRAGVGQRTQLEEAILAFEPATGAKGSQFSGKAPLAKTVALLGIRNLPKTVTVDGDVDMVITVDDESGITRVRVDGGGLTGSSMPSDYARLVLGPTFDAQVDLEAGPVAVKAPPKDLIITGLVRTG
jgi:hypothetical protein